jgi:hypothetical protein
VTFNSNFKMAWLAHRKINFRPTAYVLLFGTVSGPAPTPGTPALTEPAQQPPHLAPDGVHEGIEAIRDPEKSVRACFIAPLACFGAAIAWEVVRRISG